MITVKVYGSLKKIMGNTKLHTFNHCHNIRQLITAIEVNYKGFKKYLADNAANPFHVILNNKTSITKENISMQNFTDGDIIKIVPVIKGSGDDWGSVLSIVIGIVLLAYGYYNPGSFQAFAYGMGASMIMSGVSQLLFKPEVIEPSSYEAEDKNKSSYAFNGAVNLTSQGNAVPVGYGRLRVGSQVIGAGLYAQNI